MRPEFWIDVGGTFTDCILRSPAGSSRRCKVLSSGTIQGTVGSGSQANCIVDPGRTQDPEDVWQGYRLTLMDELGQSLETRTVVRFDPQQGALELDGPLKTPLHRGGVYLLDGGEEAPLVAMRYLLGLPRSVPLPSVDVRLGTTRGTNALLTRRGASVALVVTEGFADILEIGSQCRPHLFQLDIRKPTPLVSQVVEVHERLDASGNVLVPLDEQDLRQKLKAVYDSGIRALAVCLLHSYRSARHELKVQQIARELGFPYISISHEVSPLIKIVSRGDTTVVDAYLNPVLQDYLRSIQEALGQGSQLRLLTSAGGLVSTGSFSGKDSILSGPAGGVVGFATAAQTAGFDKAIGFDMGGTSTDVSRFDGTYQRQFETEKAGVRIAAPMMAIETVAAGGGSICAFDGVKLTVGPGSAGADPGPACYGRGGPLTVTDINLALGRLTAARLPFALNREAVMHRLNEVCQQVEKATGQQRTPIEIAAGFLQIANSNIAEAIRSISVAKGYDPRHYLLVPFGGAAGQHACAVAQLLGMEKLLFHPSAGVLSAQGIGAAETSCFATHPVYRPLDAVQGELEQYLRQLCSQAAAEVVAEGVAPDAIDYRPQIELRYQGLEASLLLTPAQGTEKGAQRKPGTHSESVQHPIRFGAQTSTIPAESLKDLKNRYHTEHRRQYGYDRPDHQIEVVAVRVEAVGKVEDRTPLSRHVSAYTPSPHATAEVWFPGGPVETHIYDREQLSPGATFTGPAIVRESLATTLIDPGWQAEMLSGGELVVRRQPQDSSAQLPSQDQTDTDSPDPVLLEILNNQFAAIAEQMGLALQKTSVSVNVKERLDFSCALFTATGDLIANAPHIPVHLGAMAETVKATLEVHQVMQCGDVFVTNNPYRGGSHLPDVTVITPLFASPEDAHPSFFAASRAHHAEIGGIAAGSMPSNSTTLAEEGVLIDNFQLMEGGVPRWDALEALLRDAPYPSRNVADNLADIAAQVAANWQGIHNLRQMFEDYGLQTVRNYAGYIQDAAATKTRAALAKLAPGKYTFTDHLDDGSPLCVAIDIQEGSATIDFTGTGPVLPGNLNANRAIVTAAVMYCLRCLIDEDIPLNQGVLQPVHIHLPDCLLNPPRHDDPARCAAVAGGNVETSQRVVDVLLGAFGLAAASQGTMNNLTFGDATFGYYETICGGAGATSRQRGASAVHTHMTNTRLTDVEVFELRFPARVRRFAIRRGSGGAGIHTGGDGVEREIEFLRPLEVSLLTQRRSHHAPYGLNGGSAGALGQNLIRRVCGTSQSLPSIASVSVAPGDVLILRTPGGGGWGANLDGA